MKIIGVVAFLVTLAVANAETNIIYGYYSSGAIYNEKSFQIDEIDALKFTHITYAFIGINEDGTVNILDTWADLELGGFTRFVGLKLVNPNLKVLVSMGGWDEGSDRYSRVINDYTKRTHLVNSIYDFLLQWGFDGLDFDWEYPAERGGAARDYVSLIDFFRELREKFGSKFLITSAVGADPYLIDSSYNVPEMNKYLDYIILMTYEYSYYGDGQTSHNAPLYTHRSDPDPDLSVDATIKNWINNGADPQKLLLGLAFYGKSFNLQNSEWNYIGAPTNGPGPYDGFVMYFQICSLINEGGWTIEYDRDRQAVIASKDGSWISYDNDQSIRVKSEYAVNNNLAGVMVWSIEYEDNNNICGTGWNVLLNTISDVFSRF